MRTILAVTTTFASAFIIVGLTALVLESWATHQRHMEAAYLDADQKPIPQIASASFFPTSAR